ncbi:AraC family transcriptional regulator [Paenibacillus pasadenensis]|uniref:AraC family transcriptional regulator n=1 Tax=Paenibacillus pasadenensis TaxID=217090 RepID=UPI00203C0DF8|nr:AraC family transcriptional regulator [Paenibacillus pasadenensis]MCM3748690.1 AraC family transcriptional regulator [Paenibacillus pasadenensis]
MDQNESVVIRQRLRQLHATFTLASYSELESGFRTEQALLHEQHCLVLPLSGRCEVQLSQTAKRVTLQPGEMYYIPQGATAGCKVADEESFCFYWICFHLDAASSEFIRMLDLQLNSRIGNPGRVEQLFLQLVDLKGDLTISDELRARANVMELVAFYIDGGPLKHDETIKHPELQGLSSVLRYIEEHLSENTTVEELAKQVFLHPNYFITYFRSLTGLTPIQYVNQRKIEHARELLDRGGISVQDAAQAVGFNNPYFSRLFKQQIGLTPRRYRQMMANRKRTRQHPPESPEFTLPRWLDEFGWLEDAISAQGMSARRIRSIACKPHGN